MMANKKYAVFTIDLESFSDTECVFKSGYDFSETMLDGLDEYVKLLEEENIKTTMFSVCDAAEKSEASVREYIKKGHRLALHGLDHTPPLELDDKSFKERTLTAKKRLEETFGVEITGFRAPFFSLNDTELKTLEALGFRYDASFNSYSAARHVGRLDLSKFKNLIKGVFKKDGFYEFGIISEKVGGISLPICGGGYTRLMPWTLLKAAIKRHLKSSDYYVFYLHPFELSKHKIPHIKGLKSYDNYYLTKGLKSFPNKIKWIVNRLKKENFEFVTFEELVDILDRA